MVYREEKSFIRRVRDVLAQDYRGVNIAVYAVAAAGLAVAVHRVRPVSKFSKAHQIPTHFLAHQEPLRGTYKGITHSPVRLLIDHHAPVYLPLWHSSKPPLPVKLWGVEIVSGNAVNWLECVARGRRVTLRPIAREDDSLMSTVLLHLPKHKSKEVETLDVGQKLVELGFARASIPAKVHEKSLESQMAPVLLSAEAKAKSCRNGIWSEKLPPLPLYVVYWRKTSKGAAKLGELAAIQALYLLAAVGRSTVVGLKNLILLPFRRKRKMQTA